MQCNKKNKCFCIKCKFQSLGDYVIDGAKVKTAVLDSVIFHHFKESAYNHLMSQTESKLKSDAIQHKLTPFEISLAAMPASFVIAFTTVYGIIIFYKAPQSQLVNNFNELFFANSFTALIAFITALILYVITVTFIYWWFSKRKNVDFFSGELIPKTTTSPKSIPDNHGDISYGELDIYSQSGGLPKLSDKSVKYGAIIRFFNKFNINSTAQGQHEEIERRETIDRSQTLWSRQDEWKKEYLRYKSNEKTFNMKRHCPFMISDCCCRLLNVFVFTLTFWISFYIWYSHQQLLILTDLPNAIIELNKDTYSKINIITEWEDGENDAMLNYYNTKLTECNNKIEINNKNVINKMEQSQIYHNNQMYPTIPKLIKIDQELRSSLDNILNGAELSSYAGDVDLMVDKIKNLAQDGINLMGKIVDAVEIALDTMCISMGVIASTCNPLCGGIISGSCFAAGQIAEKSINTAVDVATEKFKEIANNAETPEIEASTGNKPSSTDTNNIDDNDDEYKATDTEDVDATDSGHTVQGNVGEELGVLSSLDLTDYESLPVLNIFFLIGFFDAIIIYNKLIQILKRMKELHSGIDIMHDSRKDIEDTAKFKLFAIKATEFFNKCLGIISNLLLIGIPLIFICYGIYIVYMTTLQFFEIDSISRLGLYSFYTSPVIASQFKTNILLNKQQTLYNQQLLASLTSTMLTNINTLKDKLNEFNKIQFKNVTLYNTEKCKLQWSISSYGDTFYCFKKYINMDDETKFCNQCDKDIKAMCMNGGNYITKEFDGDQYNIFNSEMAEKRKYCQFDEYPNNIKWSQAENNENNKEEIFSNWDKSLNISCPDGMIINSIHFIGGKDSKIPETENLNDWKGIHEKHSVIYNIQTAQYSVAENQCLNINSNLISIHSESGNNEIYDSLSKLSVENNVFWIGLNDIKNERKYEWTDSTSFDYEKWQESKKENNKYCSKKSFFGTGWFGCSKYDKNGDGTDAVVWTQNGWDDIYSFNSYNALCKNINVNYMGIEDSSSFIDSIHSIQCIQSNRGPFVSCQDFKFTDKLFGDNKLNSLQFSCQNASDLSGYDNSAWFLQGFIFNDNTGKLSDLIGVRCCYIPGTIYNDDDGEYENPESLSNINVYGETIITSNDNENKFAIKNIKRGSWQNIQGFTYNGISDYISNDCAHGNAINCKTSRVDIVDYEIFTSSDDNDNDNISPHINVDKLICDKGCDPLKTIQCESEYNDDKIKNNNKPNPFTTKFKCDNINFNETIINKYEQCEVYPVYPALFYDYNSEQHEQMIIKQLSPYLSAVGICIIKLWHTFFIWIILKSILFPSYFILSTFLADKCCNAVRKNHFAKIHLTLKLNDNQYEKRLLSRKNKQKMNPKPLEFQQEMTEYKGNMELIDLKILSHIQENETDDSMNSMDSTNL